jgi:hypothetical protein
MLGHHARATADLATEAAPGPIGEGHAGSGDPCLLFGAVALGAVGIGAAPATLVPHQTGRSPKDGQVHQHDARAVRHLGDHAAHRAARPSLPVSRKVREVTGSRRNEPASRLGRKDDSEGATRCGKFLELLAETVGNLVPPPTALHSFASFGTKGAAKVCAHGECC